MIRYLTDEKLTVDEYVEFFHAQIWVTNIPERILHPGLSGCFTTSTYASPHETKRISSLAFALG